MIKHLTNFLYIYSPNPSLHHAISFFHPWAFPLSITSTLNVQLHPIIYIPATMQSQSQSIQQIAIRKKRGPTRKITFDLCELVRLLFISSFLFSVYFDCCLFLFILCIYSSASRWNSWALMIKRDGKEEKANFFNSKQKRSEDDEGETNQKIKRGTTGPLWSFSIIGWYVLPMYTQNRKHTQERRDIFSLTSYIWTCWVLFKNLKRNSKETRKIPARFLFLISILCGGMVF